MIPPTPGLEKAPPPTQGSVRNRPKFFFLESLGAPPRGQLWRGSRLRSAKLTDLEQLCTPKVDELDIATGGVHQDVVLLHIPMHNQPGMQVGEAAKHPGYMAGHEGARAEELCHQADGAPCAVQPVAVVKHHVGVPGVLCQEVEEADLLKGFPGGGDLLYRHPASSVDAAVAASHAVAICFWISRQSGAKEPGWSIN